MEDEVRHILRDVAREKPAKRKLGTEIAELFRGIGVKLEKLPREEARPAKFNL